MSQNSVDFSGNPNGPELMDDYLAKEQENRLTTNSGIQRPSYAQAGTAWINSSVSPWELYIYDGSEDVLIGTIDTTNHDFISSNFADVVNLTTNQTVAGVKTFSSNPLVPTPSSSDNSSKVANTAFVASVASGLQTQIDNTVKLTGNQSIGGVKTFNSESIFTKGNGLKIEGTDNNYTLRSTGSPYNGCALLLDNDTSKAAFNASATAITIGSSGIIPQSITQPTSDNSTKIATTAYVCNRVQLVNSLPASPISGVLYCIAES